jgi:hypothetical protein
MFSVVTPGRTSRHAALIEAPVQPNDADWRQTVSVVEGRSYRLCGWIRGEDIVPHEQGAVGGTIGVADTFIQESAGFGTFDWTHLCFEFFPPAPTIAVGCRLGGFGNTVTGKLWCDDFELTEVPAAH